MESDSATLVRRSREFQHVQCLKEVHVLSRAEMCQLVPLCLPLRERHRQVKLLLGRKANH